MLKNGKEMQSNSITYSLQFPLKCTLHYAYGMFNKSKVDDLCQKMSLQQIKRKKKFKYPVLETMVVGRVGIR